MAWKPRVITWLENVCSYYFQNSDSSESKAVQENTLALIDHTLKTNPVVAKKDWQNLIFAAFLVSVELLGLKINDKELWDKCDKTCDPKKVRELQKMLLAEEKEDQKRATPPPSSRHESKQSLPPPPPSTAPKTATPAPPTAATPARRENLPPPAPPATAPKTAAAAPASAKPVSTKPVAVAPPPTPAMPVEEEDVAAAPASDDDDTLNLQEEDDEEDIHNNRLRLQKERANNNFIHTVHDDSMLRVWPYVFDVELNAAIRQCLSRVFRTYAITVKKAEKTKEQVQNIAAATLLAVLDHLHILPKVKAQRLIDKLYDDYPLATRQGIHSEWQAIKQVPDLLTTKCSGIVVA